MAKKRDEIKMSTSEVAAFLGAERVVNVASNGRDGWPHVTALWFVMRDSEPWIWTYRKSQKVKNLERDDHATCLIESGFEYTDLKGVMLRARAHIEYDTERVLDFGEELFAKYQGGSGAARCVRPSGLRPQSGSRSASRSSRP